MRYVGLVGWMRYVGVVGSVRLERWLDRCVEQEWLE